MTSKKRRQKRRKRIMSIALIVIALVLFAFLLVSVFLYKGNAEDGDVGQSVGEAISNVGSMVTSEDKAGENSASSSSDTTANTTTEVNFDYLSRYAYSFLSGAGGWSDDFTIDKDGSFHGSYHDSEMGDMGDDYPNGTIYFVEYEGKFSNIKKVDDYTYTMDVSDMKVTSSNEEYIEDGVRYVPTEPYALTGAEVVEIYLPGKPISEIDEEVQNWLFVQNQSQQDTLENLGLVNVRMNQGITSYKN